MRNLLHGAALVAALVLVTACDSEPRPADAPLSPPEVFDWRGQPISFSPPPEGWRRDRGQNGGEEGVRFIKSGSVGEGIHVAERFFLGDRDRCAKLRSLIDDIDRLDRRAFARRVQTSKLYAQPAFSATEQRLARAANTWLDDAERAFRQGDHAAARRQIEFALEQANAIRYEVDDVVDRVLYSADQVTERYITSTSEDPVADTLAGEPAIRVNYRLEYSGNVYEGRRIYLVKNNRMFEFGFVGLAETLPVFESILETVSFPPGECAH